MAGQLESSGRAIVTLTTTGASMTSGSAIVANATADADARAAGNLANDLQCQFELVCQWATITSIVAGTVAAELYLVPMLDGTNLPDMDTTGGSSVLPGAAFVATFVCPKAPTANTNMRMITGNVLLNPLLYRPYLIGRAGQTVSANWSLKVVSVQGQYT